MIHLAIKLVIHVYVLVREIMGYTVFAFDLERTHSY